MRKAAPAGERLRMQLAFVREADRLKRVLRQGLILGGGRRENSAEHSWHLAVMVMVLAEHSRKRIDVGHAVQLAVVHDLAEILYGDVFIYDARGQAKKEREEPKAAARLFGKLPRPQGKRLLALWTECEAGRTPEARFVKAVDRLEPLMSNFLNRGYTWRKRGVTAAQVNAVNAKWKGDAPALGAEADRMIRTAVRRGHLKAR